VGAASKFSPASVERRAAAFTGAYSQRGPAENHRPTAPLCVLAKKNGISPRRHSQLAAPSYGNSESKRDTSVARENPAPASHTNSVVDDQAVATFGERRQAPMHKKAPEPVFAGPLRLHDDGAVQAARCMPVCWIAESCQPCVRQG
jgi:hypothetical protein